MSRNVTPGTGQSSIGRTRRSIEELTERLADIHPDTEIVAYCRGPYCVFAHEAVRLLTAHGRRAVRLADGMLEWRLANLPIESAA